LLLEIGTSEYIFFVPKGLRTRLDPGQCCHKKETKDPPLPHQDQQLLHLTQWLVAAGLAFPDLCI